MERGGGKGGEEIYGRVWIERRGKGGGEIYDLGLEGDERGVENLIDNPEDLAFLASMKTDRVATFGVLDKKLQLKVEERLTVVGDAERLKLWPRRAVTFTRGDRGQDVPQPLRQRHVLAAVTAADRFHSNQ
ncbi:unnamed protein product [Boreogadus saida]